MEYNDFIKKSVDLYREERLKQLKESEVEDEETSDLEE